MLENTLADVAGQEQAVRFGRCQRREKPQLRRRKILRLVDDDMIEWLGGPAFKSFREAGENVRPGRIAFRRQRLMDRPEYGPQPPSERLDNISAPAASDVVFRSFDTYATPMDGHSTSIACQL